MEQLRAPEEKRTEYAWERATAESLLGPVSVLGHRVRPRTIVRRRRGVQRYLVVIVDGSRAMAVRDLLPSRSELLLSSLKHFIGNFFEENPISQLQLILARDGVASIVTPLSGNAQVHLSRLSQCGSVSGDLSLKNSLTLAISSLRTIPKYGTREILVIAGSLTSCDPGPISGTIKSLKSLNIVCSIIGLAAEVFICRQICNKTKGEYRIARNEKHFETLLMEHLHPPKILQDKGENEQIDSVFIEMGFPTKYLEFTPEQRSLALAPCSWFLCLVVDLLTQ